MIYSIKPYIEFDEWLCYRVGLDRVQKERRGDRVTDEQNDSGLVCSPKQQYGPVVMSVVLDEQGHVFDTCALQTIFFYQFSRVKKNHHIFINCFSDI